MFILNRIGIFVKLIQEYRGDKFIQVGKGFKSGLEINFL